jgi:hypothetical protein
MEELLNHVVYKTVSGSRSYGLNTPTSDEDTLGAFIPRPEIIMGAYDEKIVKHFKGSDNDANYKILPDYIKHTRDGSSFWVETLFVRPEDILVLNPVFQPFLDNRELFLSLALVKKSLGFMLGMIKRSKEQASVEGAELKTAEEREAALLKIRRGNMCHSVRVGRMILEMLHEGTLRVYRQDEREHLLGIKTGVVSLEDAWLEAEELIAKIDEKKLTMNLSEKADNEILNPLLVQGMTKYWYDKKWI